MYNLSSIFFIYFFLKKPARRFRYGHPSILLVAGKLVLALWVVQYVTYWLVILLKGLQDWSDWKTEDIWQREGGEDGMHIGPCVTLQGFRLQFQPLQLFILSYRNRKFFFSKSWYREDRRKRILAEKSIYKPVQPRSCCQPEFHSYLPIHCGDWE